jgi:CRISPR-associated exonuclease Cas4
MHRRAHDETIFERRGDILTARGLRVISKTLQVTGVCDVVEFHLSTDGIRLNGQTDLWQPYPVEYKRGSPKPFDADQLQLCGQAMCLEEMLLCSIPEGSLYYGETKRRQEVQFTAELRTRVREALSEMADCMSRGCTPKPRIGKHCSACSLNELCLPKLQSKQTVSEYLRKALEEQAP